MFSSDIWPMAATLAVLIATVIFFTLGKLRSDIIALCALLSLIFFGILTPAEALSGFSNSIILTIAGVFIVGGAIVRSGLANAVSDRILSVAGTNQNVLFMLLMLITAAIGSLVSNTGTVAIMMPIVASLSLTLGVSPSRFLMPLAFMSSIGGMLTLIGNPGNMVVNDVYVKAGYSSLSLFSFLPIGLVCLTFGLLILVPATSHYLSRRKNEKGEPREKGQSLAELADKYQLASHMYRILVPEDASIVGRRLRALNLTDNFGIFVQEIRREKKTAGHFGPTSILQIVPGPETSVEAGDTLYLLGSQTSMEDFVGEYGLKPSELEGGAQTKDKYRFDDIGICELVLMSSSRLVNRTVAGSGLREQFGLTVLGIQRGNRYILKDLKNQLMQAGDALLVQGSWENLARLGEYSPHWVVVGRPWDQAGRSGMKQKIPYVATILLLMIAGMATGLLPPVVSVLLAALLMGAGGCFKNVEEAYSSINWETLVMIACMLPMAVAMEKSGLIGLISGYVTDMGMAKGPWMALALVYSLTSALNILISSTPVALLVAPVAISVAAGLGVDPLPFVFAVATASCMCFASPFSTPSNALVMSAGRYTFLDYLKIGLPLQALMAVVMILVIPLLFPF